MTIRSFAKVTLVVTIFSIAAIAGVLTYSEQRLADLALNRQHVYRITQGAGELQLVAQDYLLHFEERPVEQWNAKYQTLVTLLRNFHSDDRSSSNLLADVKNDLDIAKDAFVQLQNIHEQTLTADVDAELMDARREMLLGQLSLRLQGLLSKSDRLREIVVANEMDARRWIKNLYIALLSALGVAAFSGALLLVRRVAIPINQLREGATIIGSGNLNHRVGTKTADEIGDLSREIDKMTERLQAVMASRDELERETAERLRAEAKMSYLAHHDPLTGLPNRVLLEDRLNRALSLAARTGKKVGLLFLDLDHFKSINDTLGHPVGDEVLQSFAARLKHCVRDMDTVSRQGGDEFVILLPEIEHTEAVMEIVHKLLLTIKAPFCARGHELDMTASIGVSLYPDHGQDGASLMRNADIAMYYVKESGRNGYRIFTGELSTMVERRSLMENNLRRAVKTEEFELHYQPQMDLHTGRIIGLEALLRWRQDGYLVGPAAFIPIAEEIGLIVPLGKWVLQAACEQARRWKDAGLPMLPVAVNVSAAQLDKQGFVDDVFSALASTGVEARALKLELTESTVMQGTEEVISLMDALQRKGIKLAIDDFGVGYSSLSYLKRFPIDTLKIDQSFIHDLPNDEDDVAITQAVIRMAQSLRLHVVAEGVETAEQMDFLRRNECAAIQGNYFCAPMPAESVEPFLRHHYSNHEAQALTKFRH